MGPSFVQEEKERGGGRMMNTKSLGEEVPKVVNVSEEASMELRNQELLLLTRYNNEEDVIRQAQIKLTEVSRLMGLFTSRVEEQTEICDQIESHANQSLAHVSRAQKELTKAVKNASSYNFHVMCFFLGSALLILCLDFVTSRHWL